MKALAHQAGIHLFSHVVFSQLASALNVITRLNILTHNIYEADIAPFNQVLTFEIGASVVFVF